MAKKPKTQEETTPQEPLKKPQAVIKVVRIEIDKEFQEPEGWILKDIHNSDSEEKFYGVLVKIQDYPKPPGMRVGKPVNLKD